MNSAHKVKKNYLTPSESKLGIASFILMLFSYYIFFKARSIPFISQSIVGYIIFSGLLTSFVLGIFDLFRKNKKKTYSIITIGVHLLALIFICVLALFLSSGLTPIQNPS